MRPGFEVPRRGEPARGMRGGEGTERNGTGREGREPLELESQGDGMPCHAMPYDAMPWVGQERGRGGDMSVWGWWASRGVRAGHESEDRVG